MIIDRLVKEAKELLQYTKEMGEQFTCGLILAILAAFGYAISHIACIIYKEALPDINAIFYAFCGFISVFLIVVTKILAKRNNCKFPNWVIKFGMVAGKCSAKAFSYLCGFTFFVAVCFTFTKGIGFFVVPYIFYCFALISKALTSLLTLDGPSRN